MRLSEVSFIFYLLFSVIFNKVYLDSRIFQHDRKYDMWKNGALFDTLFDEDPKIEWYINSDCIPEIHLLLVSLL